MILKSCDDINFFFEIESEYLELNVGAKDLKISKFLY